MHAEARGAGKRRQLKVGCGAAPAGFEPLPQLFPGSALNLQGLRIYGLPSLMQHGSYQARSQISSLDSSFERTGRSAGRARAESGNWALNLWRRSFPSVLAFLPLSRQLNRQLSIAKSPCSLRRAQINPTGVSFPERNFTCRVLVYWPACSLCA